MAKYKELQDKIAELEKKAEQARANELENAAQKIMTMMRFPSKPTPLSFRNRIYNQVGPIIDTTR